MPFLKYCMDFIEGKMFRKMTENQHRMFRDDHSLVGGHNFLLKM